MAQPKEAPGKKTCAASIERSGLLTAIFTMPARLPPAERGGTRALSFGKTPPRFVNKSLFVKGGLAGGIDFFHNRILGQPCQKLDFFCEHGESPRIPCSCRGMGKPFGRSSDLWFDIPSESRRRTPPEAGSPRPYRLYEMQPWHFFLFHFHRFSS